MSDDQSSQITEPDGEAVRGAGEQPAPQDCAAPEESTKLSGADSPPPPPKIGPSDVQNTVISKRPPVSVPAFRRAASPFEMGEALEGEQLGHFQLEEFVGGGGMGAVFRAADTMLGRTVAVKVVSRDQTNDDTLRRFKNEAQSAARLDHPNIARVYYVGEDKGWNYIVFEYIEGINVRDLVDHKGPLSLEDAISYTLQIAEALEHASQREVIHRDIKPSNILIMIDGKAKLVDMGLARLHHVESTTDDLTASGVTLGTFDYISPEQARDPRNTDVRSDLYSLGCTLFFMLSGQPPFPEGTVLQKLLSHSSDDPPDLRQYRPDLSEDVALIVNRLLAKLPDKRFQSPRDLIVELLLLADRLELPGVHASSAVWVTSSQPKPSFWARHLPWVVPAVLLAAVVVIQQVTDRMSEVAVYPQVQLKGALQPAAPNTEIESPASKKAATDDRSDTSITEKTATVDSDDADSEGSAKAKPVESETPDRDAKGPPGEAGQNSDAGSRDSSPGAADAPVPGTSATNGAASARTAAAGSKPSDTGGGPATDDVPNGSGVPAVARSDALPMVIVSDENVSYDPNLPVVHTLSDAIDQVVDLPGTSVIELQFSGVHFLQPIDLDLSLRPDQKLTIRAGEGFAPVIAFRPDRESFEENERTAMVRMFSGQLTWHGTQFYLEVPRSVQARSDWSLFQLNGVDSVEFLRCSFTIRNVTGSDGDGAAIASFFEFAGSGSLGGFLPDRLPMIEDTPTIGLQNCIARGQATLVRSEQAVPFLLRWETGLFVSTQRLIEVGGTKVVPRWDHGRVTLFLRHLLAVADRGIGLMKTNPGSPYQLGLGATCYDCLFATQVNDPPTPLYVLRGGVSVQDESFLVDVSGENNYYRNTKVVLRVESNGDHNAMEEYTFDDLKSLEGRDWFNEKTPRPATLFSWTRPSESVDRQTQYDFIPMGITGGPFTRVLGLEPSLFPRLPDFPIESESDERRDNSGSSDKAARLQDTPFDTESDERSRF